MRGGCALIVIIMLVLFFFASLATVPEHGVYGLIIPAIIGIILFNIFKTSGDNKNTESDGTTITIHSTKSANTHHTILGQSDDSFGPLPLVMHKNIEEDFPSIPDTIEENEGYVNSIPSTDKIEASSISPIEKNDVDEDFCESELNEYQLKTHRNFRGDLKGSYDNTDKALDESKPLRELKTGSIFHLLVNETQRDLEKELSPIDLLRLFGIYDNLKLPPEVISLLVKYCISEHSIHSGGRMPSMHYIENAARKWARDGIFSLDEARDYLKPLESRKLKYKQVMKLLQIKDRGLTKVEKQYIDGWLDLGFTADTIKTVYTRVLMKSDNLIWSYMDSVLRHWYSRKFLTLAKLDRYIDKTWDDMKNADDNDIDDDYDDDDGLHSISVR